MSISRNTTVFSRNNGVFFKIWTIYFMFLFKNLFL
jgi:hypothetical protein